MAPTVISRVPTMDHVRHISRSIAPSLSKLSLRDVASSSAAQPLTSLFALIVTSRSSISRRALTSIAELPRQNTAALALRSIDIDALHSIEKRQTVILAIPTTYAGLNDGPAPGAVVGITLGTIGGFLLVLWIIMLSVNFYGNRTTTVKEEVIVKRRSHRSKSRKSSSHHSTPPPPRRETIVEIEEEIIRHSSRRPSPSPEPEEVIVEEEATTVSEEIVVVEEEQSSIVSVSPSPPPRRQSSNPRRSGFRTVDPAEFGGGSGQMRRMSRRSSGRE